MNSNHPITLALTAVVLAVTVLEGLAANKSVVNGTTQTVNVFKNAPDWASQTFFCFKAGAYVQDNEGTTMEGARVLISKLKVSHSDAASPASGNPAK